MPAINRSTVTYAPFSQKEPNWPNWVSSTARSVLDEVYRTNTKHGKRRPCDVHIFSRRLKHYPSGYIRSFNSDGTDYSSAIGCLGRWEDVYYVEPEDLSGRVMDMAVVSALNNLKDKGLNLPVTFGELGKTVNMIKTRLRQLRSFSSWASGKTSPPKGSRYAKTYATQKKSGSAQQNLASNWLEYRYGWIPLLSDLDAGMRHIAGAVGNNIKCVGRESLTSKTAGSSYGRVYSAEAKFIGKCVIYVQANNAALIQAAALGITNPLNVAWELLPYSFVVDWFIPIQNTLNALDATLGYSFVDGCISYSKEIRAVCKKNVSDKNSATSWEGDDFRFYFQRYKLTSFPSPGLPSFNPRLNTKRMADSIALFTNAFRR